MASSSTMPPLGSAFTAYVDRAGLWLPKSANEVIKLSFEGSLTFRVDRVDFGEIVDVGEEKRHLHHLQQHSHEQIARKEQNLVKRAASGLQNCTHVLKCLFDDFLSQRSNWRSHHN